MATINSLVQNDKVLGTLTRPLIAERNALVRSGLAVRNETVDRLAAGGPRTARLPYLLPLSTDAVNVSNADITDMGDIDQAGYDEYTALRHDLNRGFSVTDLEQMVTKYDQRGGLPSAFADYWVGIETKTAASSIVGALKAGGAALTYTGASGESLYSAVVKATAKNTGDNQDSFDILIVNNTVYSQMRADEKNAFVPASRTESRFEEWAGFKLVKSNAIGDIIVARSGALAFGEGVPTGMVPFEIERVANGGNGGGGDILHTRRSIIVHPQGFSYTGSVAPQPLKVGATASPLEAAASWSKALGDEQIGFRKVVLTA